MCTYTHSTLQSFQPHRPKIGQVCAWPPNPLAVMFLNNGTAINPSLAHIKSPWADGTFVVSPLWHRRWGACWMFQFEVEGACEGGYYWLIINLHLKCKEAFCQTNHISLCTTTFHLRIIGNSLVRHQCVFLADKRCWLQMPLRESPDSRRSVTLFVALSTFSTWPSRCTLCQNTAAWVIAVFQFLYNLTLT